MAVVGTWTYSGDPRDSNLDAVRFLIGDTIDTDQKISNEEIAWLLTQNGSVYLAAASAATGIAATYTSKTKSKTVGPVTISYAERAKEYTDLAARLTAQAKTAVGSTIMAYAGGISKADKEAQEADTDWAKPFFWRGQFDGPGADDVRAGDYPRSS